MQTHHALFRFGLGPRLAEIGPPAAEARAAVLAQLDRAAPVTGEGLVSGAEGLGLFFRRQEAVNAARRDGGRAVFVAPVDVLDRELAQRIRWAVETEAPLLERLALHWANHFTVGIANFAGYFSGAMEREAIRPNMLGRFEAMLLACTTHPAMLFYLDNRASVGPNSRFAQRRRAGLNENLAREVLELHTLGADGGYSQADVVELAKVLTGWTVDVGGDPAQPLAGRIGFFPELHEPGPKTILGRRYAQDGPGQLPAVLRDLARHPATARHVTRRLVLHMVGEKAPPALATHLAGVFRQTGGDLGAVTRALVTHPASWETPPGKLRPPLELVFSAGRMLGALPHRPPLRRSLRAMGQPWGNAPSPAGWPEQDDAWAAPDSVKTRLDWAIELSGAARRTVDARQVARAAFAEGLSTETRRTIDRAASGGQALALLLMSPEFQRR